MTLALGCSATGWSVTVYGFEARPRDVSRPAVSSSPNKRPTASRQGARTPTSVTKQPSDLRTSGFGAAASNRITSDSAAKPDLEGGHPPPPRASASGAANQHRGALHGKGHSTATAVAPLASTAAPGRASAPPAATLESALAEWGSSLAGGTAVGAGGGPLPSALLDLSLAELSSRSLGSSSGSVGGAGARGSLPLPRPLSGMSPERPRPSSRLGRTAAAQTTDRSGRSSRSGGGAAHEGKYSAARQAVSGGGGRAVPVRGSYTGLDEMLAQEDVSSARMGSASGAAASSAGHVFHERNGGLRSTALQAVTEFPGLEPEHHGASKGSANPFSPRKQLEKG